LPFYLFWYGICIFRARFIGYKESKIIIQSKGGCTMKTKLPIIAIVAILFSACTTGTHLAKSYDDDIYFSPKDVAPVAVAESKTPAKEKSTQQKKSEAQNQQVIISEINKNTDGSKVVTNSVYQTGADNSNQTGYDMNNQDLIGSDTTVYYNDDDVKYVINNYYDDNDMSYADQFNRFYGPYYTPYYSPYYYDDFYYGGYWGYPYWGFSVGIGWGYPYYGYGWGWGYPYYPYYGWGYPYYGCGYPGYGNGGYYPYYNDVQVSQRRTTNMNASGGGITNTSGRQSNLNTMNNSMQQGVNSATGKDQNTWVENGHTRGRTIDASGNSQNAQNATVVNDRRGSTNPVNSSTGTQVQNRADSRAQMTRPASNSSVNVRRSYAPSTTGSTYSQSRTVRQSQNYTPSYNKPRIVNQSNYNNSYARPRTSNGNVLERAAIKSANSGNSGSSYSQPRSSSSMRQTYRSSSSYSSGSSSSMGRGSSYSSPSSGSSPSYSAPSRSSSGSSYSGGSSSGGGGGYSGGSSGGGGGGGSGHRR
jgi:hypothetical protein